MIRWQDGGVKLEPGDCSPALAASVAARATADPRTTEAKDPEAALEALTLAAEGYSTGEIRARTRLGKRTVERLRADHREAMAEERLKASRRAAEAAELARRIAVQSLRMMDPAGAENEEERAGRVELLRKANVRDLAVSFGVLIDKAERLADQPPVAAEREAGPTLADAAKALELLRAAASARCAGEAREAEIERRVPARLREIEEGGKVVRLRA